MTITWHGQTCFKIVSPKGKDGATTILIDTFKKEIGLKSPKNDADVLLLTEADSLPEDGESFLINGPGEYDVKGVSIFGIDSEGAKGKSKNVIYTVEIEDIRVCHLGKLSQKELTTEQLESIGNVDILMVPVGGGESIESKEALKVMEQIEPKVVIPMYYKVAGLKENLEDVSGFLKSLGIKELAPVDKLTIKAKELSAEEAKIVVLNN